MSDAAYARQWRINHIERVREYQRKYYRRNAEERRILAREYSRRYYATHREAKLAYERKRRQERKERGEALLAEVLGRKVNR